MGGIWPATRSIATGRRYTRAGMDHADPAHPLRLLVDGRDVAAVRVATTRRARARGLLGRPPPDGALLFPRTSSVHGVGMRFALDVALCTAPLDVVALAVLQPGGLVLPRRRVRAVLEAPVGSFAHWGLQVGSQLSLGVPAAFRAGR